MLSKPSSTSIAEVSRSSRIKNPGSTPVVRFEVSSLRSSGGSPSRNDFGSETERRPASIGLAVAGYLIVHPSRRGRGVVFELAFEPEATATRSGAEGACSGLRSGNVRPLEGFTPAEKTAPKEHRSVSARSHDGKKRGRRRRTLSSKAVRLMARVKRSQAEGDPE